MELELKLFKRASEIVQPFNGVLLDAYGVFWSGGATGPIPGAAEEMKKLCQSGKLVGILSNTTVSVASEIEKLSRYDIIQGTHFHFLITSGSIASKVFKEGKLPFETPNQSYFLPYPAHPNYGPPSALFEKSPFKQSATLDKADFLFPPIPHINGVDVTDKELFRPILKELIAKSSRKLPLLCINPDPFAHEGTPATAVVRQGSIAALYTELGGEVFYIGKPGKIAFDAALERFAKLGLSDPEKILMIGDTPETDIRGARLAKLKSALIIATGMMKERLILSDLATTIAQLDKKDYPDFIVERL